MRNLGPKSRDWLHEIGIDTPADLVGRDPVDVYLELKARRPKDVSLNMLWALAGAVIGCAWNDLPPDLKAELKRRVEASSRRDLQVRRAAAGRRPRRG
ncbi:MAG: TfoX/Sxy family protein [Candidatus Sericytochromatia bacterium]